jgi:hypothetical protein
VQLIPEDMDDVKRELVDLPEDLEVKVDPGVPEPIAKVKTVADLRSLPVWPEGLALVVRRETDRRFSYVGVERRP